MFSGEFRDPVTGRTMSLRAAIDRNLVDGEAVTVVDPTSGARLTLREAVHSRVISPDTCDVINPKTGEKILSFTQAVKSGLLESVTKPTTGDVIDQQTGDSVPIDTALHEGLLDAERVTVYDPSSGRRIQLSDAIRTVLVDEETMQYRDPDSGRRYTMADAVKLGLVAIAGAPVMATLGLAHGVQKTTHTEVIRSVEVDKGENDLELLSLNVVCFV